MNVFISNSEGSVQKQVYDQIKNAITTGNMPVGTVLPSSRILAKELRISVLTTQKAYEELVHKRFINRQEQDYLVSDQWGES